jgi:C1A family cysteine protease
MKLLYNIIQLTLFAFVNAQTSFDTNMKRIIASRETGPRWELDINKFSSISHDEFSKYYKGYNANYEVERTIPNITAETIPDSWDWRDQGNVVAPVKNQGQCGSCWAFSAVGALESQVRMKTNDSVLLSEQKMVDCVKNVVSPDKTLTCCNGCQGGEMYSVYQFLNNGMDSTEQQYPYTGKDGSCKKLSSYVKQKLKSYVSLPKGNEKLIAKMLYTIGPLSIGVNANLDWQMYSKGIYDPSEKQCDSSIYSQDHGVILVGYGSEKGLDYWIIRNSWGKDWGENGYIRLARGSNACGVSNSVIYPILQ